MKTQHRTEIISVPYLSVLVPLFNEEENVGPLHRKLVSALESMGFSYEIVYVDDGSTDSTYEELRSLKPATILRFRKNFGQTAALDAAVKASRGDVLVTIDGDLQNDPGDISLLLEKLNEGYDVVSGWRYKRQDSLPKRVVSRSANLFRKFLFRDSIHDSGCALKVYRRTCFESLDLYGEHHRFVPALLEMQGFKIGEVKVNHYPRAHGKSKYGNIKRGMKSLVDMILISFWSRYSARPMHIFGVLGAFLVMAGIALLSVLAVARVGFGVQLADRIWPLIGVFSVLTGVQMFTLGLILDVIAKTYYRIHQRMNYNVAETHTNKKNDD